MLLGMLAGDKQKIMLLPESVFKTELVGMVPSIFLLHTRRVHVSLRSNRCFVFVKLFSAEV